MSIKKPLNHFPFWIIFFYIKNASPHFELHKNLDFYYYFIIFSLHQSYLSALWRKKKCFRVSLVILLLMLICYWSREWFFCFISLVREIILVKSLFDYWDCPSKISSWFMRLANKISIWFVSLLIKSSIWFRGSSCVKSLIYCNRVYENIHKSLQHYFNGILENEFLGRGVGQLVK